jgi:polyisoprenoid-binding protein YceI
LVVAGLAAVVDLAAVAVVDLAAVAAVDLAVAAVAAKVQVVARAAGGATIAGAIADARTTTTGETKSEKAERG